jgi:hypothetical protein
MVKCNRTFLSIIFLIILLTVQSLYAADKIKIISEPSQKTDARYRIYRTDNFWNQLLLDTQTGKLWQISYGIESESLKAKIPINVVPFATGKNAIIGRFTLYPTDNMWNFLLLDQIDGRVWQCQFGTSADARMITPLEDIATNGQK